MVVEVEVPSLERLTHRARGGGRSITEFCEGSTFLEQRELCWVTELVMVMKRKMAASGALGWRHPGWQLLKPLKRVCVFQEETHNRGLFALLLPRV